ncbi:MAG: hypothetical protein HYZ49_18550 [Chloroflexi bacterium]|nr:hypothetical protein [Chloroflexota bacterium]
MPNSPSPTNNFGAASVGTNNRGHFIGFTSASGAISSFVRGALSPGQQDWKYTNYTYPASGPGAVRPHAVTGLSTGESYSYDANGNMTTRVEGGSTYTQTFDVENRLASVVVGTQTTTFVYDADGALVKKVKPDGTSTLYLGSYEVELSAGGTVTKKTTYYPAGGAMRVDIVGGTNTVYYMLSDHLGSASVLLKSDGTIEANGEQRYYPFGESRITTADLKTAHLFTGQIDTGLGIYSFGARFYSQKLGRFISADTVVPDWKNPQSLNRYSYAINNPLKFIDPTGHSYCDSEYAFEEDCEEGTDNSSYIPNPFDDYDLQLLGEYTFSAYVYADEKSGYFSGSGTDIPGIPDMQAKEDFLFGRGGVVMQGTGLLDSGQYIHIDNPSQLYWADKENYRVDWRNGNYVREDGTVSDVDHVGNPGDAMFKLGLARNLTPYYSVAGPKELEKGTLIYAPALASHTPYDGVFEVQDRGGAIKGQRFDLFVGVGFANSTSWFQIAERNNATVYQLIPKSSGCGKGSYC